MKEKALVVIPTYNEADNLPRIAPLVLAQDDRIEILVVDDGSPDGTGKIADNMAEEEPRIHVLRPAILAHFFAALHQHPGIGVSGAGALLRSLKRE